MPIRLLPAIVVLAAVLAVPLGVTLAQMDVAPSGAESDVRSAPTPGADVAPNEGRPYGTPSRPPEQYGTLVLPALVMLVFGPFFSRFAASGIAGFSPTFRQATGSSVLLAIAVTGLGAVLTFMNNGYFPGIFFVLMAVGYVGIGALVFGKMLYPAENESGQSSEALGTKKGAMVALVSAAAIALINTIIFSGAALVF